MTVLYPDLCYNKVCYKGTVLYHRSYMIFCDIFTFETCYFQAKLDEMEKSIANPDVGSDLRGVKALLKKHQVFRIVLAHLIQNGFFQAHHLDKSIHNYQS